MPGCIHEETDEQWLATPPRRRVLTIAAGGILTLGGGVLLPAMVEETDAANRAKRRRKRRRRSRPDTPPQSALNPITFHVQNLTPQPVTVAYWDQKDEVSDHSWFERDGKQLPANPTRSYDQIFVSHYAAAWPGSLLWIANPGILVRAVNEFLLVPDVTIGRGGAVSAPDGWTNGTTLFSERMHEGAETTRTIPDPSNLTTIIVTVHRNDDMNARKIYSITLEERSSSTRQ